MKRFLATLLSVFMLVFSISACFFVFSADSAAETGADVKKAQIKQFSDKLDKLTGKYDKGKDFVTPSEYAALREEIRYAATGLAKTATGDGKYTYADFQTGRLIVYADQKLPARGAVARADGYEDMHILQYPSAEDAVKAYEYYRKDGGVTSVRPDLICELAGEPDGLPAYDDGSDFPSPVSWGNERTHTEAAKEYILQDKDIDDLPEIVVGVIDDGIPLVNPFFAERVIAYHTFLATGGNPQTSIYNHGARVAGVLLDETLPNVKLISYQAFSYGYGYLSDILLAEAYAVLDGVDILNCSFTTTEESIHAAQNSGILVVAAAGNSANTSPSYPAITEGIISVASSTSADTLTSTSCYGPLVDVAAPGENIQVLNGYYAENQYQPFSGTSCAAAFVTAACAMILSENPAFTNEEVKEYLFGSCENILRDKTRYGLINMLGAVSYFDTHIRHTATPTFSMESRPAENQVYTGAQTLTISCADAGAQIRYTTDKTYPTKSKGTLYTGPITLSKATEIWAVAYSDAPFASDVAKRAFYIRVSSGGALPNENGWSVTAKGLISAYSGPETDPVAPGAVFGVTVTGVADNALKGDTMLNSITLPATATSIGASSFEGCTYLTSVTAPGLTAVGSRAFYNCNKLNNVSMPLLTTLKAHCFYNCGALTGMPWANFEVIPSGAFSSTDVTYVSLPNAKEIGGSAFSACYSLIFLSAPKLAEASLFVSAFRNCRMLERVELSPDCDSLGTYTFFGSGITRVDFLPYVKYIGWYDFAECPNLTWVKMESVTDVGECTFDNCPRLYHAEFPNVKSLHPGAFYNSPALSELILSDHLELVGNNVFENCPLLTYVQLNGLEEGRQSVFDGSSITRVEFNKIKTLADLPDSAGCVIALPSVFESCSEATSGRNYKIYGTKGTAAESWALGNGHQFIEVSQETAIVKDVPASCSSTVSALSFDVIGFNRTYQWYGSVDGGTQNGTAIDGATSKEFIPSQYEIYPFYYCVVTSTDIGCQPVVIVSGASQNTVLQSADYTAYDAAVATANALDRNLYNDLAALDAALAVDVSGKNITEQDEVDAQAQAILAAVSSLVYKPADYTAYNAAVAEAKTLNRYFYIDLYFLNVALSADVSGKDITQQNIVDIQTQAILKAIDELEYKPADYTVYHAAVAEANALDRDLYVDFNAVDEALAVDVSGKNITQQADVDTQAGLIAAAIDELVRADDSGPVVFPDFLIILIRLLELFTKLFSL